MSPEAFCRDTAAPPGSNLHYAVLFHPPEHRRALHALFALRAEILGIETGTPDAGVVAMRRSWWAEELARVAARQARHPVGIELQQLAARIDLDVPALQLFAAAGGALPETGDLQHRAGAGVWSAAARACDVPVPAVQAAVHAGGLVDLAESVAAGHISADADGGAQRRMAAGLRTDLDAAGHALLAHGQPGAEFCLILTRLAAALCQEMERDTGADRTRFALTPLRKLWIAWRTHRSGP